MERERETTREQCLEATPRGSSYKTRIVTIRQTLVQGLSSEECTTTLSIKRVPLKAAILLLIFAFGSFTVSGSVLPFTISEARKTTGTFLLTTSPSGVTLPQGANATSTVSIISIQGYSGTVSLAAQFTAGNNSVSFNPTGISVQAGGTATSAMTVVAAKNASIGRYNITITGASGTVSHSCVLTVNVVDPVPESLTLTGSALLSPTGMTLSLRNDGNTPITLESYTVTDVSGDQWILANWTGPTML